MSERLKHEGRLGEQEREAKKLRILMGGIVVSIRDLLDPIEDVEDLEAETILEQAVALNSFQIDLKEILAKIAKLKKILGR